MKMHPYPHEQHTLLWNEILRGGPEFMEAVRKAVGEDIDIGLDAHAQIFEPIRALELADALAPYNPFFLEEPIRPENIRAMAHLRRKMTIPLATGECLYTKFEFNELLQAQAADIIQPDVCVCGGLSEMRKIAALAEGHDVMVAPHNPMGPLATAINVHFAAATYNFSILEFVPHHIGRRSEFVKEPWIPKDGYLEIPDKPGWGMEVNEEALKKHPPQSYRRAEPYRPDGSPAFI